MPYYGGGGGSGGGGTSDHRILAGRSDANQHPAAAVSVTTIGPLGTGAGTVQRALEMLADRNDAEEIAVSAAVAIGIGKAVAFRQDGTVEPADHDNPAHLSRLAGITLASASAGTAARVRACGSVQFDGWNWTPGAPVFVGRNGDLTQTPPATGFVQSVGMALGRDVLWVHIGTAIRRN